MTCILLKPTRQPPAKRKNNVLLSDSEGDGPMPGKQEAASRTYWSSPKSVPTKVSISKPSKPTPKRKRLLSSSESEKGRDVFQPSSDGEENHRHKSIKRSSPKRARASTRSIISKEKSLKRSRVEDDRESEAAYTSDEKPKRRAKSVAPLSASARSRKPGVSTNTPPRPSAGRGGGEHNDIPVDEGLRKDVPKKRWMYVVCLRQQWHWNILDLCFLAIPFIIAQVHKKDHPKRRDRKQSRRVVTRMHSQVLPSSLLGNYRRSRGMKQSRWRRDSEGTCLFLFKDRIVH